VSFSTISKFDYRRSSSGPPNGLLQFQVGPSDSFHDITNVTYSTGNSGVSIGSIDLSAISALQNVTAGTLVTFRIVNWGASNANGTWYIYDKGNSTASDFEMQGTVTGGSTAGTGWYVDTISLTDPVCCSGVTNSPPVINVASISPSLPTTTNELLAVVTSASDPDGNPITFAYQWQQSINNTIFTDLGGQTASNLAATITVAGDYYRVIITPNDGITNGAPFTTASVLVPIDADGNGLNDDWEVANFDHIGVDPNADPDGDSFSNLAEFLAGTEPNSSSSALRITAVAQEGNDIRVTWSMGSGKTNALQATAGGAGGDFTNNFAIDIFTVTNTVGTTTNYLDVGGATNVPAYYYRVRLVP
jgi:hypothetical protein